MGTVGILFALVALLLALAIRHGLKKVAHLPAAMEPVEEPRPRWEREICAILARLEKEEVDAGDDDLSWHYR